MRHHTPSPAAPHRRHMHQWRSLMVSYDVSWSLIVPKVLWRLMFFVWCCMESHGVLHYDVSWSCCHMVSYTDSWWMFFDVSQSVNIPNAPILYKPCTNYFTGYAHPLTLLQPQTCANSFYFSFFSHAVAIWNSLPYFIVSSPNISMFKKVLLTITYFYNLGTLTILAFAILYIHCTRCIKFS